MHQRDHTAKDGLHYRGQNYYLVVRAPGSCRISVPADMHYLDINLGRSNGSLEISDLEACGSIAPPSTFVFLPAVEGREIRATRSGWSVQLSFDPSLLNLPYESDLTENVSTLQPILHVEDEGMISLAKLLGGVWADDLPELTSEQTDAIALLMTAQLVHIIVASKNSSPNKNGYSQRIQAMLDHVEENLDQVLSLNDLAKVAGVSPYHFARIFRQATGRSPHKYVIERRVACAKAQLLKSDDAIASIAIDCGFGSQSHMTDVFGKVIGMTPGSVRKYKV